jgi:hypothetical protein
MTPPQLSRFCTPLADAATESRERRSNEQEADFACGVGEGFWIFWIFQCVPKVFFPKKASDFGFSAFWGIVRDFVGIEFLHFWDVRGLFGKRRGFFGNRFPEISGDFRRFPRASHD